MLPSSSNVGVVTGWGKQGSVGEVHPNPLAELGVMCREKRQCWDAAESGMLTASLLCPTRYGKLHVQANGDHARHAVDERMELKK